MLPTFPVLMIACAVLFAHGPVQAAGTSGKDPEARAGARLIAAMRAARAPAKDAAGAQQAFIDRYCSSCHNGDDVAGSLDLSLHSTGHMGPDAEVWEKVSRKLRGGMMPPADADQPPAEQATLFAASVEQSLDRYGASHYQLPASTLGRLNRTEYANAIRDILGLEIDTAALLPPDDSAAGFDNMAAMLALSPALVDGYVAAAMRISRDAVGDLTTEPAQVAMQPTHSLEGLPLGTRGGWVGRHFFPLDARYDITITSTGSGTPPPRLSSAPPASSAPPTSRLVVILDGKPLQVANPARFTLTLPAGTHTIGAAIIELGRPGNADGIFTGRELAGAVTAIRVRGPTNVTGRGTTPSRQRLFVCQPASAAEEADCARRIFAQLATRAYRRPVDAADEATLRPLMGAYSQGRARGDFDIGIQHGVARVLVDPRFLFRVEVDPPRAVAGRAYPVSDLELASRLSFFLWSSVPDDELLRAAVAGQLSKPVELKKQVERMLADPKSGALAQNFAAQWLSLRSLAAATPDDPAFDEELRRAMNEETQLLFSSVLRENRPVTTLLDADYTFLNDRLARHYGIDGVRGSHMRRVALPADSLRRGLLGQASVLTVTSVADRTSPVTRGKWVLENLLGLHVPLPPPGVETNLDASVHLDGPATLRKRLEVHRENPSCRNCHAVIDPIGFALEPFDKIGRLRTEDEGLPIDARGTMVDGTAVNGPEDVRESLVRNQNVFLVSFTEKLLTYALGRPVTHADGPIVRDIVRKSRAEQYKLVPLVMNIVRSVPFQQRAATGTAPNQTVAAEMARPPRGIQP